jgi:hypothetical protein
MTNLDRWAEKWEKIEGSEILQTNGEIEKNFQIFQVLARALNCFDDSIMISLPSHLQKLFFDKFLKLDSAKKYKIFEDVFAKKIDLVMKMFIFICHSHYY